MILHVKKSFEKDIERVVEKELAEKVFHLIEQLEKYNSISEIPHLKKLSAKGNYYRIRLGNYRIGIKAEYESITLIRFMNRKDIYKYFP